MKSILSTSNQLSIDDRKNQSDAVDRHEKVRVCIQQPSLAAYRVPLYREIAKDERISLRVVHGEEPTLPNAPPDGFKAEKWLEINPRWLGNRLRWHSAQTRLATKKQCDVLVLSGNIRYGSLIPGMLKARRRGVGTVLWGHHQSKSGGKTADWLRRHLLFPLADSILCYSEGAAQRIRQDQHLADKVFFAPNSIEQASIAQAKADWLNKPEQLAEFRDEQGIGAGPNLLFVSRIKPRNQLDVLVYVLQHLRRQYPSATASIIGAQNEERDRIERLCEELGLRQSVLFPGAIYDEQQLAPWFLSADLFFYPAQIGLSIFHAFGYGLPVVAGYAPQRVNPEFEALIPDYNGFAFAENDVEQATKLVLKLMLDGELRQRLAHGALQTVKEHFNVQRMAQMFIDAIVHAAGQRSN